MNLEVELLREHSKAQCDKIVRYIGNKPDRFSALMELFFKGEYRITQRAAWPMSYSVQHNPSLIKPYFKPLIDNLRKKGLHDAILRNTLRILQDLEVPKKYHGKLMSICFDFVQSNEIAIAIKVFSLTILYNLSKIYPEIKSELKIIIEERWPYEKAGFHSRGRKILRAIS